MRNEFHFHRWQGPAFITVIKVSVRFILKARGVVFLLGDQLKKLKKRFVKPLKKQLNLFEKNLTNLSKNYTSKI